MADDESEDGDSLPLQWGISSPGDYYEIDGGEAPPVAIGHHGEDEQEVAPPPAQRRKRGRTTTYDPRYANMVRAICKMGATDFQLGEIFGVHRITILCWRAENPDFAAACRTGKREANKLVEEALFSRATGYDLRVKKAFSYQGEITYAEEVQHVPADVKACLSWLYNREPENWRNIQQLTGANGAPLIPRETPQPKEIARWLSLMLSRAAAETVDAEYVSLSAPDSKDED